ncbi:hypothetical protein NRA59_03430 [Acinetobacter baumannii]|nr:hypothetical protein [Acinetobacter baumannii]
MNSIKAIRQRYIQENYKIDEKADFFLSSIEMEGFQKITEGRYSYLFVQKLIELMHTGEGVSRVLREVKCLEGLSTSTMKPETKFKRGVIKGLWHKHYLPFGIDSFSKNLQKQLNKCSNQIRVDYQRILNRKDLTDLEKADQIARIAVSKYSERSDERKLTGEWIIFHKYQGKNYYLDISCHDDSEDSIASNLKKNCLIEFPEFKDTLPIFK